MAKTIKMLGRTAGEIRPSVGVVYVKTCMQEGGVRL